MKITELRCTACNSSLNLDDTNPSIAVCEYCQTTYIIYKDDDENAYVRSKSLSSLENQKSERWYVPEEKKSGTKSRSWEYYNWKCGIVCSVVVLIIIIASRWGAIVNRYQEKDEVVVNVEVEEEKNVVNLQVIEDESLNGIFADVVATVLQKPINEISTEELSRFKWIEVKYTQEAIVIGYSFELLEGSKQDTLEWIYFPGDTAIQEFKELSRFTGLKKLEIAGYLSPESVEGLHLESLTCYARLPMEIAEMIDTTSLKELNISGGMESLEGISKFENLEKLSLVCGEIEDIKELVNQKRLKSLTIGSGDEINDFTVISLISGLEELTIESEKLRDIDFLKSLTNLRSFSISDAQVLQVNTLGELNKLTELSIKDCDELKDLSVLEGLTILKTLVLEVPYNCQEPDLSALSGLHSLSISGVKNISFLRNMKVLQELNLEGGKIDNPEIFTHLTELKSLKCSYISDDLSDWNFVTKLPSLESLDLSGISTYKDISDVFAISSLQKLLLNGAECEIDFNNIGENPALKVLEMDGMKLYKNVQVWGENGFYAIDYDKVSLDENIDFLKNFKGLTDLSLADNMLTGIDFVKEFYFLKTLDISENYITDLRPLQGLSNLENVNCTENPIENYRVLSDKVAIAH